ncbi:selenide, water dikinase [Oceaniferula spumae]|uniref:Selenide, water dikinase n=1 Tax=Oceaniferula spumae TaxID=2979115 RepID=A0AAT9FSF2_9BACT
MFKIDDERALVQTTDFFTPIVDDPVLYGRIAAANALSDVYAMGGRPITALAIAGMPSDLIDNDTIRNIFRGGAEMCVEAECSLLGGHTIKNPEPIYGLAVTGIVHPDRHLANANARPGETLVLTKPLGSGIVSTGIKRGECSSELAETASQLMATLNKPGAVLAERALVRCCTDVTGFGLGGHLIEMCEGSGVSAEIDAALLPLMSPEVLDLIAAGCVPGGSKKNLAHTEPYTHFSEQVSESEKLIYADAQTSGGLLLCVPDENLAAVMETLEETGAPCAVIIGKTTERREKSVYVTTSA